MTQYIEILATHTTYGGELRPFDLWAIGEFTRENIVSWLKRGHCFDGMPGIYGFEDFHAVCGDIDIPWTTEEGERWFSTLITPHSGARRHEMEAKS